MLLGLRSLMDVNSDVLGCFYPLPLYTGEVTCMPMSLSAHRFKEPTKNAFSPIPGMLPESVLLQGGHFGKTCPVELGLVPSPNLLPEFFCLHVSLHN